MHRKDDLGDRLGSVWEVRDEGGTEGGWTFGGDGGRRPRT